MKLQCVLLFTGKITAAHVCFVFAKEVMTSILRK